MVNVAQLAERQIVVLDVVGSTPTIHPSFLAKKYLKSSFKILADQRKKIYITCILKLFDTFGV